MTPTRESQLLQAANLLLDARRTLTPIAALPSDLAPATLDESFFLQDTLAADYGAIGGYKIGAPSLEATPLFSAMPAAWIAASGTTIAAGRYRGLEAEIAFLLGQDLPPRAQPYPAEEVYAAVASAHPAIEILESALIDPLLPDLRLQQIGDLAMHGGFIFGAPIPDWQKIDFAQEGVVLAVDGSIRVERTGSNTSGDLLRLLPYLANEGAARTGGLRAGQWITTGSWTGVTNANAGSVADVDFTHAPRVSARFA